MNLIQTTTNWKRSFLLMGIVPVIFIGTIYIVYGSAINSSFVENKSVFEIFKFSNQFYLFEMENALPSIVQILGRISIIILNFVFTAWLCLNILLSYLKLSKQEANQIDLFFELLLLVLVYLLFVSPSNLFLFILGCLVLVLNLSLIVVYLVYYKKQKQVYEKR